MKSIFLLLYFIIYITFLFSCSEKKKNTSFEISSTGILHRNTSAWKGIVKAFTKPPMKRPSAARVWRNIFPHWH